MLQCCWWIRGAGDPGQMLVIVVVHCGIGALGNPQYLPCAVADGVDVLGTARDWGCVAAGDKSFVSGAGSIAQYHCATMLFTMAWPIA
jgi:hypothetical protein